MGDIEVTVHVPDARVSEFYRWFGSWLETGDVVCVPARLLALPLDDPWTPGDELLAREMLKKAPPVARELLFLLVDNGGRPVNWRVLAKRTGVEGPQAVAQLVADLVVRCHAAGRRGPLRWVDNGDGPVYWLDRDEAAFWGAALSTPKPPGLG